MAVTIEELELQITSESSSASEGLDALIDSLSRLKAVTKGSVGLTKVANQINKLNESLSGSTADAAKLKKIVEPLTKIKEASKGISDPLENVTKSNKDVSDTIKLIEELNASTDKLKELGISSIPIKVEAESLDDLFSKIKQIELAASDLKNFELGDFKFTSKGGDISGVSAKLKELKSDLDNVKSTVSQGIDLSAHVSSRPPGIADPEETRSKFSSIVEVARSTSSKIKQAFEGAFSGIRKVLGGIASVSKGAFSALSLGAKIALTPIRLLSSTMKELVPNTRKATTVFGKFGGILKRILVYRAIRGMITGIINSFKEGTQNLAMYSGEVNAAMSQLSTGSLYLKNTFAAMLAPAVQMLIPLFDALVNAIARAANAVNQFLSAMMGKSSFTKAKKYAVDYADSLGGASSAAKELKNAVGSIDELNIISQDDGSGAGAGKDYSQMFEEMPIDSFIKDLVGDSYGLGKGIAEWLANALEGINWTKIRKNARKLAENIADFLNGFIDTPKLWRQIGRTVGEGLNTAFDFAEAFADRFKWHELGESLSYGLNTAIDYWDAELAGRAIYKNLNGIMDTIYTFFTETRWGDLGAKFSAGLNTIFSGLDADLLGRVLMVKFNAIFSFLHTFVTDFNWIGIGNQIGTALNGAIDEIDYMQAYDTLQIAVTGVLEGAYEAVATVDWEKLGSKVADALNSIRWPEIFADLTTLLSGLLGGVFDLLIGFVENFDFFKLGENLWNSLVAVFTSIDYSGLVSRFFELLGAAFAGAISLAAGLISTAWDTIVSGFNSVKSYFQKQIEEVGGNIIQGIFNGIIEAMKNVGTWIKDNIATPFVDGIKSVFGIQSPATLMMPLGENITEGIGVGVSDGQKSVLSSISDVASSILGSLGRTFGITSGSSKEAKETGVTLMLSMTEGVTSSVGKVTEAIGNAGKAVLDNFNKTLSISGNKSLPLTTVGTTLMSSLSDGVTTGTQKVIKAIQDMVTSVLNTFDQSFGITTGYSTKTKTVGETLVSSLGKGIEDKVPNVNKTIKTICETILKDINTFFGISGSTSSKTYDIGKILMESLAKGISESTTVVKNSLQNVFDDLEDMMDNFSKGFNRSVSRMSNSMSDISDKSARSLVQPVVEVQGYASGGFVKSANLFATHENGIPEMVGRIGNRTAVANNDQLTTSLENAAYRGVSRALAEGDFGGGNDINMTIVSEIDGEAVGKSVHRFNSRYPNDNFRDIAVRMG